MKKLTNICLFLVLFLTLNCGFKIVDKSQLNNFSIKEIKLNGDKRINFKIKNNLIINSTKNSNNVLFLNIETKKTKKIKEKNIKNQITKYEILLNTIINYHSNKSDKYEPINLTVTGSFLVAENYSDTLNNEKKLVDSLIENISNEAIEEIGQRLDDI
tara:strand:+ start:131 stop:604 length:474 start_codon:yes stop_codon:yes gene_type:complete